MPALKGNNYAGKNPADLQNNRLTVSFTDDEIKKLKGLASVYGVKIPDLIREKVLKSFKM